MKLRALFLATTAGFAFAATPAFAGEVASAVVGVAAIVGATVATGGIGAVFAAGGFSGFAGVAANLGGALVLSALGSALTPDQNIGSTQAKDPGIQTKSTTSGSTEPVSFPLGRVATGGNLAAPLKSYSDQEAGLGDAEGLRNLSYVIDVSDIPGVTLRRVIVNGEYAEPGSDGDGGQEPLEYRGRDQLQYTYYDGHQTEADPILTQVGGDYAFSDEHVGTGIAYIHLRAQYDREIWQGKPSFRVEVDGIPLYDPRRDSSVGGSGSHRYGNPDTYAQTDNPAVMIYNILRGIEIPGEDIWGGKVDAEDLPLDNWFAAMNECDRRVSDGQGGTDPQYRAGYEVKVDQEPAEVIEEFLKTCSGEMTEFGGVFTIRVGSVAMPSLFITPGDIVITEDQVYEPYPEFSQTYNSVHISYPEPGSLWETVDAPPIYRSDLEARDGDRRLTADLKLNACYLSRQVQRLGKAYIEDERRFRKHIITLPSDAAVLSRLDSVAYTDPARGYDGKVFEVVQCTDSLPTLNQSVVLRERDPDDYDPPEVYDQIELPVRRDPIPTVQDVPGWAVIGVRIKDATGRDRRPALRLSWFPPDNVQSLVWQVRRADDGETVETGSTTAVDIGAVDIANHKILHDQTYQARARFVANRPTAWSAWLTATTPDIRFSAEDLDIAINDTLDRAQTVRSDLREAFEANDEELFTQIDEDLSGVVSKVRETYATQDGLAGLRTEVSSDLGDLQANVEEFYATKTSVDETVANSESRVTARVEDVEATAGSAATAVADLEGNLQSSYVINASGSNGNVASGQFVSGVSGSSHPFSAIRFSADEIQLQGRLRFYSLSADTRDLIQNTVTEMVSAVRDAEDGAPQSGWENVLSVTCDPSNVSNYDAYFYIMAQARYVRLAASMPNRRRLEYMTDFVSVGTEGESGALIGVYPNLSGRQSLLLEMTNRNEEAGGFHGVLRASMVVEMVKR